MIKASELRKGNYVSYYGETSVGYILGMSFSEFSNDSKISVSIKGGGWAGTDLNDITPIPLTEEWLKKFGFKSSDYADLGISISLDLGDGLSLSFDEVIWIGEFKTNCKHVHQLQNLYFALTSQELNANNE